MRWIWFGFFISYSTLVCLYLFRFRFVVIYIYFQNGSMQKYNWFESQIQLWMRGHTDILRENFQVEPNRTQIK